MEIKKDVYELVTEKIIEQMEQGIIPWNKPWHGGLSGAISYTTGKPYSILNQLLLGKEGEYLTYKQVQALKGRVKKGAKGNMVVFFKLLPTKEFVKNEEGEMEDKEKRIPVLRYYLVYHIDDCEGIKSKLNGERPVCTLNPSESAEKIISDYYGRETVKLNIQESDRAYYSPSTDEVVCPKLEQYDDVSEYYSTIFHETTHSTGHKSRLNRDLGHFFGTEKYSKEELIAEMGAAFLCHTAGVSTDSSTKNSAGYLQGWIKQLKSDKRLIVSAASRAEKAVRFILTGEKPTIEK